MAFGICTLSVIPCRAEPSDKAEIVTQLIFGEVYSTIDEIEKWVKIKNALDGYESWIDKIQFEEISQEEYLQISNTNSPTSIGLFDTITSSSKEKIILPLGASLPSLENERLNIGGQSYKYENVNTLDNCEIDFISRSFLNSPYQWGGRTHFGIDCSGFSQIVFKIIGILLPRDAYQQAELGTEIPLNEAKKGDLAYFTNKEGRITHVGIMLNSNEIIHASGKVRIDDLNESGIVNRDSGKISHDLKFIKRIQ